MTREEFKRCFDDWFDEIRNYISYRCCDAELATDIVQEAYVKMWEKNMEYREESTRSLLYKIAIELWISHYRKSKSEQNYKLTLSFNQHANSTEESVHYRELKEKYEEALVQLPEKRRAVFMMSRMDQMSYQEISDRLKISVKAVEKRMHLALQELRKVLNYA